MDRRPTPAPRVAAALAALAGVVAGLWVGAVLGPWWAERGRQASPSDPPAGESEPAPARAATSEPPALRAIRRAPLPTPYATRLDRVTLDLDADGDDEVVELFAAVDRDARGRLMWDDGQRWMLRVREPATEGAVAASPPRAEAAGAGEDQVPFGHLLFDDFVQLGRLSFWVVVTEEPPPVLLLQLTTGAGVRMWSLRWDEQRDAYVEGPSAGAAGNVVHRTPDDID